MADGRVSFTIPILAVVAFAAIIGWFGYRQMRPEGAPVVPALATSPTDPAPTGTVANPASPAPDGASPGPALSAPQIADGGTPATPQPAAALDPSAQPKIAAVPAMPQPMVPQPGMAPQPGMMPSSAGPPQAAAPASPARPSEPAAPRPAASAPFTDRPAPKAVAAPAGAPSVIVPSFDVVRVEPTGESVVAGKGAPGATVELLVDGQVFATGTADASGAFALVPPPLPPGSHEVTLRTGGSAGAARRSDQVVTVMVADDRRTPPLVTVAAAGSPTVILSRPDAAPVIAGSAPLGAPGAGGRPAPTRTANAPVSGLPATPTGQPPAAAANPIQIVSVESERAGRIYVSGTGKPGATARLYLDDELIGTATAGADGRIAFAIERGLDRRTYRVRLDEVDAGSGTVRARAEVPFSAPAPVVASLGEAPLGTLPRPVPTAGAPASPPVQPVSGASARGRPAAAPARTKLAALPVRPVAVATPARTERRRSRGSAPSLRYRTGAVSAGRVRTITVGPGESLWAISQRLLGSGERYTVIYGANSPQIKDPNVIYPGQIFVLPASSRRGAAR